MGSFTVEFAWTNLKPDLTKHTDTVVVSSKASSLAAIALLRESGDNLATDNRIRLLLV